MLIGVKIISTQKWEIALNQTEEFEKRKRDHIKISLDERSQTRHLRDFDQVELIHEALPELDFSQIQLESHSLGRPISSPFFISSMTAGHIEAANLNKLLANAAAKMNWTFAVGSQRRQLFDTQAESEWLEIRNQNPNLKMLANIGIAQLIQTPIEKVLNLAKSIEAEAIIVHLNPLQECIQPEGTPQFKGAFAAIKNLANQVSLPIVVKETGCGVSGKTVLRLKEAGIKALDVAGKGGTHWGLVEAYRSSTESLHYQAGLSFGNWGIGTVQSVLEARGLSLPFELWGSGGVRSGLDAAKLLALGCRRIGIAQPLMKAAIEEANGLQNGKSESGEAILHEMRRLEYELKVAMFCTGSRNLSDLQNCWKLV